MKVDNLGKAYSAIITAAEKKFPELLSAYLLKIGAEFLRETRERTPVDYGTLRNAWALAPLRKVGNRIFIRLTNPQKYSAFVEFGYTQRPGMILKMKKARVKLRFVAFLGYAKNINNGDPKKQEVIDVGDEIVICTRKRFIPGRFMARDALILMRKKIPVYNAHLMGLLKRFFEQF